MYTQKILYNIMLYCYVFTEIVSSQLYISRFWMTTNIYIDKYISEINWVLKSYKHILWKMISYYIEHYL